MASIIVDTAESICTLVGQIESAVQKPLIFIDLEGVNLSRTGVIAIMQILVPPNPIVRLIDVYTLGKRAFDTSGADGQTLKAILESKDYPKVFFDVRNDSDALHGHYQISLNGVVDLQLLEFASRPRSGRFLKGLAKCILEDGGLDWTSSREWQQIKQAGQRLFAPEKGGKYQVFLERPLSAAIQKYCAQDVLVMPLLLKVYGRRVSPHLAERINAETLARVVLSQRAGFNGQGRHMAIGPSFVWNGSRNQAAPDFPMSLVFSDRLAELCSIDEVRVDAELGVDLEAGEDLGQPSVGNITTGEAQQEQEEELDNSASDIVNITALLKNTTLIGKRSESI